MLEDAETRLAVHEAKGPVSFIGKPFTKELVSEYIAYDAETGGFARIKTSGTKKAGDKVGVEYDRYLQISICGKKIRGHQLAWFLTYGYMPKTIDHIIINEHHQNTIQLGLWEFPITRLVKSILHT